MTNPWLGIPLADYEDHMRSAAVQQLDALSDLFAEAVEFRAPSSIAILGVAGGNGLDRIDSEAIHRIVGIDVNQDYLDAVRRRYPHLPHLELHCADLAQEVLAIAPVQLVHAALVFEHAGTAQCLDNAVSLVAPNGALSVVLQLPSKTEANVGSSGYSSLQRLSADFSLIDPIWLRDTLAKRKFTLACETRRAVPAGKELWMGVFDQDS
jgi:trans-aconitate methyltransferase